MSGFILLHRDLLNKPIWFNSTPEQKVILVTLLSMATWKETDWDWNGNKFRLMPGQIATSQSDLAKKCGKSITVQKIKTALNRFEALGFLTNQSTNQGRLITIENWRLYQDRDFIANQDTNQALTKDQPRSNQDLTKDQPAYNKQGNKIINKQGKKENIPPLPPGEETTDQTTNGSRDGGLPLNTGALVAKTPAKTTRKTKDACKVQYAEFVRMAAHEYTSLIDLVGGEQEAKRCIEILDDYKGASGKAYKDDYRAIRSWVLDRLREEQSKRPKCHSTGNRQMDEIKKAMELLSDEQQ